MGQDQDDVVIVPLMTEQERRLQQFLRQSFTYTGIQARLPYGYPSF